MERMSTAFDWLNINRLLAIYILYTGTGTISRFIIKYMLIFYYYDSKYASNKYIE